jgi:predicted nucleic acid-binding protein
VNVFADTSYFVATASAQDQWYGKAEAVDRSGAQLITSSLVIDETLALLQRRGHLSAAFDFLQQIRSAPDVTIVYVDAPLQAESWDLFIRHAGGGASPVDCASFAIMRRLRIKKALTFDRHFRAAGFEILR